MVPVIVKNLKGVVAILQLKASPGPLKCFQRGGDRGEGHPEVGGKGDDEERVVRVVLAGNAKLNAPQEIMLAEHGESCEETLLP